MVGAPSAAFSLLSWASGEALPSAGVASAAVASVLVEPSVFSAAELSSDVSAAGAALSSAAASLVSAASAFVSEAVEARAWMALLPCW